MRIQSILRASLLLLPAVIWPAEMAAAETSGLRVVYDVRFDSDERGEFLNVLGTIRNDKSDLSFPLEIEVTLERQVDGETRPVSTVSAKQRLGESGAILSRGSEAHFNTYFDLSEFDLGEAARLAEIDEATKRRLERELLAKFSFSSPR